MSARHHMKLLARRALASAAVWGGYCRLVEASGLGRGLRILGYHGVNDAPACRFAVSARAFAAQMEILARRWNPVGLTRAVSLLLRGEPLPERAVAVTIDDGYRDAYTHAFPIAARLRVPLTVFLPTACVDGRGAAARLPQREFLSWDEVRQMHAAGVEFGSHTVTHVSLAQVPWQEARRQLRESKARLEAELGVPVEGLAYPYGTVCDVDCAVERLAEASGYRWAVSGISGLNRQGGDPYALRRTAVLNGDGTHLFSQLLRGAADPWVLVDRLAWLRAASRRRGV